MRRRYRILLPALIAGAPLLAVAQSTCTSDGQPQPRTVYERFINADCASCWTSAPGHAPGASAVVVDWIVPGSLGDHAPLAAAATRDGLERLQALQRPAPPAATDTFISDVAPPGAIAGRLRVARGPAVNDYAGTGISLVRNAGAAKRGMVAAGSYPFTLLLVERIPAGTEGSPVVRHLVRNALHGTWSASDSAGAPRAASARNAWLFMDNRPMRIPDGAQPDRLEVVGWMQDGAGRMLAAAQAPCRAGAD